MSAQSLATAPMVFEGSGRVRNATRPTNDSDGLRVVLDGTIQTLSTQNAPGKGPVKGLLFVPSLDPQDPCNNATASLVPANSTRHSHVAPFNFPNIGLAPWVSIDCTQSFLNASRQEDVEALIFFLPSSNDSKPPAPEDSIWNLGDSGAWKNQNKYPVFAIPGPAGETLMRQLSWYSDNATLVGIATGSILNESSAPAQQHDVVRLLALIDYAADNGNMPSLWGFILAILGMVLVLSILLLFCYQLIQKRRRRALERRIAAGEADIENFGLHHISVSREILDQLPTYVYPTVNVPSKASLKDSPSQTKITLSRVDDTSSIRIVDHLKEPRLVYKETDMQASSSTIRLPESAITCESSRPSSVRDSFSRSQPTCAICLDDFVSGTTIVRELPCGHIFHPSCIDVSLTQISSLCPLCKKSVLPAEYYATPVDGWMVVHRDNVMADD